MPSYHPIAGHTTSPRANWGEDDDTEHEYTVTCDGRVAYRVLAVDAWTAERKARKLYCADAGEFPTSVNAEW